MLQSCFVEQSDTDFLIEAKRAKLRCQLENKKDCELNYRYQTALNKCNGLLRAFPPLLPPPLQRPNPRHRLHSRFVLHVGPFSL